MAKVHWRKQMLRLSAVLLGVAMLACLVFRTGVHTVVQQTEAVGWGMALIIALGGISHLIKTWSWRLTFLCDLRQLSFGRAFALRLVSEGIGKLGLAGQVVGETTRVSLLGSSVPIANSVSSVTLDRGLYLLTSAIVSVAGIISALLLVSLSESWRLYLVLLTSVLLLLLVATVVAMQRRWPLLSRCAGMIARLPWCRVWVMGKQSRELTYGGFRASSEIRLVHLLLLAIGTCSCFAPRLFAETSDSRSAENKSWTATTDLKGNNLNPARIIESHSQTGNRTLDEQSVQIWVDGRFQFNEDIERETLQLDANTVRITTRKFGQDGNGRKTLVQVTEEEKRTLPGGDSNVIRMTSDPDVNGKLQPVQREIVETNNIGNGVEEANTTVLLPSIYGGLAPAIKMHELRKRSANNTIESQKTTLLPDGAGNWQVSEVRQATSRQEGTNRTTEERVSRLDSEGKLGEVSHVVSKESESTSGEKRSAVETYSLDVPGTTRDGSLHLVERKTSTERSRSTGERATEQNVEQTNPGDSGSGLRLSVLVHGRMVPGPSGFQATRTVRLRDLNGNLEMVEVDTTKSDKILTIQVQQTPAEKP